MRTSVRVLAENDILVKQVEMGRAIAIITVGSNESFILCMLLICRYHGHWQLASATYDIPAIAPHDKRSAISRKPC